MESNRWVVSLFSVRKRDWCEFFIGFYENDIKFYYCYINFRTRFDILIIPNAVCNFLFVT